MEQEFKEKDVVRKYQMDYDQNICMVQKYPEAMQTTGVIGHPADTTREPDDESEVTEARTPPGPVETLPPMSTTWRVWRRIGTGSN